MKGELYRDAITSGQPEPRVPDVSTVVTPVEGALPRTLGEADETGVAKVGAERDELG